MEHGTVAEQMEAMESISLSFSQEEVVLLLKILGANTIPGVGQQPFGELDNDTQRHLLASAERTLRSRGLLAVVGERIQIDRTVVALVGTCAVPKLSWLVTQTRPGHLPENRFYHISPTLFVEHTISGPGVHTFTAVVESAQVIERLMHFWQPVSSGAELRSKVVSNQFLQSVLRQLLIPSQDEQPSTDTFVSDPLLMLKNIRSLNTIAMVDHSKEQSTARPAQGNAVKAAQEQGADITSTSFLQLEDSLWQTFQRGDQQIELRSIEPNAIRDQICDWLTLHVAHRRN